MKKINLYFGLTLFIGFLATGYYMAEYFKPEHLDNHVMRMQIRANHIYILFISLLNVVSFKCDLKINHKLSKYLDTLFRIFILIAGIVAVVAFLKEHTGNLGVRSWTLSAVTLSVVSVGLVLINELINIVVKKKSI
ncbi:hypothetical protein [Aquimarina sp. AU474]|uniref:hypothetical protein n=1 Tax=Aquimarina sp. AU474 TaxID=2108529 RepID=UPI00135B791F|nr:hypothetical protein [Aquimarina sp. AU474]